MKRIGIDCRFAAGMTGLGRYTRELVTYLLRRSDSLAYVLFVRSVQEEWLRELPRTNNITITIVHARHYSLLEQYRLPCAIHRSKLDLFFSPHFNAPLYCPAPLAITVHDLILHRYPNRSSPLKQAAYRFVLSSAIRRARRIIAVSHFTAEEIRSEFGQEAAKKITVIPEGVDARFVPERSEKILAMRKTHRLEKPYFLYVGNAKEHKNIDVLIEAFQSVFGRGKEAELVLVSGGKEIEERVLPEGVRRITCIPDRELPALYSGAVALVTASLYEGFCLPVVEAQASGCPVIASNRTAIRERAMPGTVLIEPTVQAFANALRHPPDRSRTIEHRTTWERAAEQTASLLMEATKA